MVDPQQVLATTGARRHRGVVRPGLRRRRPADPAVLVRGLPGQRGAPARQAAGPPAARGGRPNWPAGSTWPTCASRPRSAGRASSTSGCATSWIADQASRMLDDPRLGLEPAASPQTVVVEYSSPNIAKEMHVGHLRTTIVGDAIARVAGVRRSPRDQGQPRRRLGHAVRHADRAPARRGRGLARGGAAAHRPERLLPGAPGASSTPTRSSPSGPGSGWWTCRAATRPRCGSGRSSSTCPRTTCTASTAAWASRSPTPTSGARASTTTCWPTPRPVLEDEGLAVYSDGALCVFPPGFTGREGRPLPVIIRKRDGGYNYATTDLATIRYRVDVLHCDRAIYVVGSDQTLHFQMVFAVAREAGWIPPRAGFEHAQIGLVLGARRRPAAHQVRRQRAARRPAAGGRGPRPRASWTSWRRRPGSSRARWTRSPRRSASGR